MRIYSVFVSVNGEVCHNHQGSLTTFIRTAGCDLRCRWCDTRYAQEKDSGEEWSVEKILTRVKLFGIRNVTVTGGEPLIQFDEIAPLLRVLKREKFRVCVETNGAHVIPEVHGVNWVVDCKTPSSGYGMEGFLNQNSPRLNSHDFIKFVVAEEEDFEYALERIEERRAAGCKARYAFSPMLCGEGGEGLDVNLLVKWMKAAKVDSILSVQLHKLLNLQEDR